MRWILLWIMPPSQDRSLVLLANSPARYRWTTEVPNFFGIDSFDLIWAILHKLRSVHKILIWFYIFHFGHIARLVWYFFLFIGHIATVLVLYISLWIHCPCAVLYVALKTQLFALAWFIYFTLDTLPVFGLIVFIYRTHCNRFGFIYFTWNTLPLCGFLCCT